ncbi:MAG TPA: hypothetical protein VEK13_01005 [Thermoplasmata archaeon]|nr:hypothetical protein [Thermoplasmata archaeon]
MRVSPRVRALLSGPKSDRSVRARYGREVESLPRGDRRIVLETLHGPSQWATVDALSVWSLAHEEDR